jgi:RNA polymerase sigma factor (sigma-70 family)
MSDPRADAARTGARAESASAGVRQPASGPAGGAPDLEQFHRLVLPHLDAAFTFARFLTRGDAIAEDVVQDACLRALRSFGGYRGGDPKAWLFAIVRNCFLARVRTRNARERPGTGDIAGEEALRVGASGESPEAALIRTEEATRLRRLIEALPAPLCEVLVLREVEDMSYREIAVAIDAPIGTVMSRLARARAALADAWREAGGAGDRP